MEGYKHFKLTDDDGGFGIEEDRKKELIGSIGALLGDKVVNSSVDYWVVNGDFEAIIYDTIAEMLQGQEKVEVSKYWEESGSPRLALERVLRAIEGKTA